MNRVEKYEKCVQSVALVVKSVKTSILNQDVKLTVSFLLSIRHSHTARLLMLQRRVRPSVSSSGSA